MKRFRMRARGTAKGASGLGYGLAIGLVAVIAIAAIQDFGGAGRELFADVNNRMAEVTGQPTLTPVSNPDGSPLPDETATGTPTPTPTPIVQQIRFTSLRSGWANTTDDDQTLITLGGSAGTSNYGSAQSAGNQLYLELGIVNPLDNVQIGIRVHNANQAANTDGISWQGNGLLNEFLNLSNTAVSVGSYSADDVVSFLFDGVRNEFTIWRNCASVHVTDFSASAAFSSDANSVIPSFTRFSSTPSGAQFRISDPIECDDELRALNEQTGNSFEAWP